MMFALEYFSIFPFPALPTVTAVYTLIISWASYVHSPQTAFPAPFSSGCSRCHSQPLLLGTTLQLQTNFKLQSSELLPLPLSPCCLMHYFHLGKFSTSFLLVNIFLNSPKGLLTFMNNTMKSHLLSSSSAFCVFSRYSPHFTVLFVFLSPRWLWTHWQQRFLFQFCSQTRVCNKNWI